MRRQSDGMHKGCAGTGQVLNAEEHFIFLRRRRHKQRLALSFACFERHSRIAHLPRQHQPVEARQRFVNHNRPQLGGFVHGILPVLLQIPRCGLFNIPDPFETRGRLFLQATQKFQQVANVGAALVEVERIPPSFHPALCLNFSRRPIDPQYPVEVPVQIVAVQLDLNVGQAVVTDPSGQGLRQAVVQSFFDVRVFDGIGSSDRMVERQQRAWGR